MYTYHALRGRQQVLVDDPAPSNTSAAPTGSKRVMTEISEAAVAEITLDILAEMQQHEHDKHRAGADGAGGAAAGVGGGGGGGGAQAGILKSLCCQCFV
jgi:hypothetical protein